MKTTTIGAVKRVDGIGRVVIPKPYMQSLGIKPDDYIKLILEGDNIILTGCKDKCIICGNKEDLITVMDKPFCRDCVDRIKQAETEH